MHYVMLFLSENIFIYLFIFFNVLLAICFKNVYLNIFIIKKKKKAINNNHFIKAAGKKYQT